MLEPCSYPHRPRKVHLRQTHASLVFIAAPYVYKIKKPVNLGFLGFSTLEKRRHFCEREAALNRRLSPDIYLGVVPISRRRGRLVLGDGDEVVEYAVKMKKLSAGRFLDQLVDRGVAGRAELDRVAVRLREFYRQQAPTKEIEEWGRIGRLRISTDENFRPTEPFVGQTISRPAFQAVESDTCGFYRRHVRDFAARVWEGRIRDCHGDLHLEHIHLSPRDRRGCVRRTREYFQLALRYAVVGSGTPVVAVMGRSGTGKSTLAAALGRELGWAVYSSDRIRKELAGIPPTGRGDARTRRRLYSAAMTRKTYEALLAGAAVEISAGRGVILDGTFSRPKQRAALLRRNRDSVCFLETTAADRTIRQRLRSRDGAPGVASDARSEDFEALPAEQRLLVPGTENPDTVLSRALAALVRPELRYPCHTL